MKKWIVLLLAALWGCSTDEIDNLSEKDSQINFELNVPSDFTWSAVLQDVVLVNVLSEGEKTNVLDGTLAELYNEEDKLLDVLVIEKGTACFNIMVPANTRNLKLKLSAVDDEKVFSVKKRSVNYEIDGLSIKSFKTSDSDEDGVLDEFDTAPNDPQIAISLKNKSQKNDQFGSYFIFEDLWPTKGDFDFNDIIIKTSFSWQRGKSNSITQIKGICEPLRDNPEFGVGFELFEARGAYLIYLDDVIEETEGAEKISSIKNGFIVFDNSKSAKTTSHFTIKLRDESFTNFVCLPFIYRFDSIQHQIRPFGTPPTQIQEMHLFHSGDDASPQSWNWVKGEKFKYPLDGENAFYRTKERLPWGVQFMAKSFTPPADMQSILQSYPRFKSWAESGGVSDQNWYEKPGSE